MASKREKELEAIVRKLMPALRNIAWCHLVWNDHNFTEADLFRHAIEAGEKLGFKRKDGVDSFNEFWEHVESVLGSARSAERKAVVIKWLKRLFKKPAPRQLVCVSYFDADVMLREDKSWRIAPEEDKNRSLGMVWLERDLPATVDCKP